MVVFEFAHLCFSETVEFLIAYPCYLNKYGLSCSNDKQNAVTVHILIDIFVSRKDYFLITLV